MNQIALVNTAKIQEQTICLDNIHATFAKNTDGSYDVVLEINSNKFLIAVDHIANHIERMEIIATKGFVELSNKIILMIKKLIEHLRYKID